MSSNSTESYKSRKEKEEARRKHKSKVKTTIGLTLFAILIGVITLVINYVQQKSPWLTLVVTGILVVNLVLNMKIWNKIKYYETHEDAIGRSYFKVKRDSLRIVKLTKPAK